MGCSSCVPVQNNLVDIDLIQIYHPSRWEPLGEQYFLLKLMVGIDLIQITLALYLSMFPCESRLVKDPFASNDFYTTKELDKIYYFI
jgi:hypothetical protein